MRMLHLIALATCTFAASQDVRADTKAVSLGEVSVGSHAALTPKVVSAVQDELGRLDLSHAKKQAVLSVSVVQLDSEARPRGTSTTCVVSATLRNPKTGAVFAVVEGRARAEGPSSPSLETSALRGAVHGAVTRIPDALK